MEKGVVMIDDLLSRLDKVRATSKGRWVCKCPSHEDKSPSMHIRLEDDGRILINCKAGCGTYEILQSIGLDWSAVFPDEFKGDRKPIKRVISSSDGLRLLQHESRVVLITAYDARKGTLNQVGLDRLEEAMERINMMMEACGIEQN